MSLPQTTTGGIGGGNYFKPAIGANKIAILGDVIEGYEYWTSENKPVRSKEKFTETPDIKIRSVKNEKTGEQEEKADSQKYFWAVPVYSFATKSVEVFQITQKGIRDGLAALEANEDWGDPTGSYTVTINREGEGLLTKYTLTPNPKKAGELTQILKDYKDNPIDLDGMFFKEA